ncbi:transcription initiation factor TFIID component TAF4 [Lipomyces oligophaga]|uniref:transcription initiation factor TFIID component TAF4 n=1 Tax=Lipomyces oligophaga TaxID=45792 RepID=UPI0034CF05DB
MNPANAPVASGGSGLAKEDPSVMSDAIISAGIDLRAEEELLLAGPRTHGSMGNTGPPIGTGYRANSMGGQQLMYNDPALMQRRTPFLNLQAVPTAAAVALSATGEGRGNDAMMLISLACKEWLSDILTAAIITARYRRDSGIRSSSTSNASDVAKALRQIAIRDKELEDKYQLEKAQLEIRMGSDSKPHASEEVMHRQTNATAAMMVSGGRRKKYSWMTGTAGGAGGVSSVNSSPGTPGVGSRDSAGLSSNNHGIRIREAREEPGVVMRDLLYVLENERDAVRNLIMKGWCKLRD